MKLFIDPEFWLSISFVICMAVLAKVLLRRVLVSIDQHMHQRQELLATLRQEEKALQSLLKQEKHRALAVAEERKVIKQQLKAQISVLRSSMQDRVKQSIKMFEENYERLRQNMIGDFDYHLQTTVIQHVIEGTREVMKQPSMQKTQQKHIIRQLKNLH